jgi:hypothetical protein
MRARAWIGACSHLSSAVLAPPLPSGTCLSSQPAPAICLPFCLSMTSPIGCPSVFQALFIAALSAHCLSVCRGSRCIQQLPCGGGHPFRAGVDLGSLPRRLSGPETAQHGVVRGSVTGGWCVTGSATAEATGRAAAARWPGGGLGRGRGHEGARRARRQARAQAQGPRRRRGHGRRRGAAAHRQSY